MTICPKCLKDPGGLGTYCWDCNQYTELEVGPTIPEKKGPPDTRSEDERKRDARPTVEAMGWIVCDMEQGWRPFECQQCKAKIPGGARVTLGLADWFVMGHGLVCFMEWKSGDGKQSGTQKEFQGMARVAGIPYRSSSGLA